MAKFPLSCKDKKIQVMIMGFSELEIDVAWQLVQMSSRDNKLKVIKNKKNGEAEQTSCQSDASNEHALNTIFEDNIFGEEDDDGYPKRRNKRFRSINRIYEVTQPVLAGGFIHSKKVKLSCS